MSKQLIATVYLISLTLVLMAIFTLAIPIVFRFGGIPYGMLYAALGMISLGAVIGVVPWIGTLINLGTAQAWNWFTLALLFGGIVVPIYLIADLEPPSARLARPAQPWGSAPPFNAPPVNTPLGNFAFPPTNPPAYTPPSAQPPSAQPPSAPQPPSALEILQQRYARGEIDTATYDLMRARLGGDTA